VKPTLERDEVMIAVRRGAEWLVLHRAPDRGGYWHTVAGGVEPRETAEEAAGRELQEEVGLDVSPVVLDRTFTYVPEDWEPRSRPGPGPFRVTCFVADAPPEWEPSLDREHDEHRWCTAEAAAALLFWPEARLLLEELACAS
jgi:8-oxo-dGTP pyrophosphatase MutT (NUDIX family)